MYDKGVIWDTERGVLTWKKQDPCLVERHHGQWVIEYNPSPPSNENAVLAVKKYKKKSKDTRVSAASPNLWHDRLAHCGPEVIEHLPTAMTGVKVTSGPSATECNTCGVGKVHNLISRRLARRANAPFERIHWDLIEMEEGYNEDRYVSHLLDDRTRMNPVPKVINIPELISEDPADASS